MSVPKAISDNSPVTIGLAGGLVVAAFFGGNMLGRYGKTIDAVEARQAAADQTLADHGASIIDHEARLTTQERLSHSRDVAAK
ncbi:hypothetical protein [Lacipirellula sp.]|uniref:hypothetical protein n=1 Tax=Lacipirellula sp. TaxID=2691419 RepID=UPI003D0E875F